MPGPAAPDTLAEDAVLAVMIVVIHVCWLLAGTSFRRVLYDPLMSRIANLGFAAMLVATVRAAVPGSSSGRISRRPPMFRIVLQQDRLAVRRGVRGALPGVGQRSTSCGAATPFAASSFSSARSQQS